MIGFMFVLVDEGETTLLLPQCLKKLVLLLYDIELGGGLANHYIYTTLSGTLPPTLLYVCVRMCTFSSKSASI